MMDWGECESKFIRKTEIDKERINSIIEKAEIRLKLAKTIKINEETVSFVVEDYYEVIKELLVAYLLSKGLKSSNHQCLITYFYKENSDCEYEAKLISQLSFYRNRLNYYGETIPISFYEKNKKQFEEIIKLIKNLIKKEVETWLN